MSIFTFCEDDSSEELETNIISAETPGKERLERKNEDKGKEKKSDKMLEMRKIKRGQHQKKANDNLIRRKRVAKKRKKLIIVVTPKGWFRQYYFLIVFT